MKLTDNFESRDQSLWWLRLFRRWAKFGKCHDFVLLGKDVIATASGVHVCFFDLSTRERRIERFDDDERGSGASCLAGHPVVPMFSVAERRANSTISIFTYPWLQRVSRCRIFERVNGYLSCSFAGTEYLLSLTTYPDFRLIVWLWRTGEKVATIDTNLNDLDQNIVISSTSPYLIAQFSPSSGKIAVYQKRVCSKIVTLFPVNVEPFEHRIVSICWTMEGNLFICDEFFNLWLMSADGKMEMIIAGKNETLISCYKSSVTAYRDGAVMVNAERKITFYRKVFMTDGNASWQSIWSTEATSYPVRVKTHHYRDSILLHARNGDISEITVQYDNIPRNNIIQSCELEYKLLASIFPHAKYVAAIDRHERLNIFDSSSGQLTDTLSLRSHGEVLCMTAHNVLPIIVTSSATGNCLLIDVARTNTVKILKCFHLHAKPLDKMRFSNEGNVLGIVTLGSGDLFIIGRNFREGNAERVRLLRIEQQITDFLIYDKSNDNISILIHPATKLNATISAYIVTYTCCVTSDNDERINGIMELFSPYNSLHYGPRKDIDIVGTPYLSKQLHRMEIQGDFDGLLVTVALPSMHRLRNMEIDVGHCSVVTCGYDGLIVVRDGKDLHDVIAFFMAHHRTEGGAKYALESGEVIVSLGRNGDLIASKLCFSETIASSTEVDKQLLGPYHLEQLLSNIAFSTEMFYEEGDTWIDSIVASNLKMEIEAALPIRNSILSDIEKLKRKISELLNENEREPIEVRLPLSSFNLDHELRAQQMAEAELKCENLRRDLEDQIAEKYKISQYLREICWDPQQVHACDLRSISEGTIVQNFPLGEAIQEIDDFWLWEQFSQHLLEVILKIDEFIAKRNSYVDDCYSEVSKNGESAENGRANESIFYNILYNMTKENEKWCSTGTTTHRWIKNDTVYMTHQLINFENEYVNGFNKHAVTRTREYALMKYFNDRFEEMRSLKKHQMSLMIKWIERLNHCATELKNMFGVDCSIERINIPEWHPSETADYVVTIKDDEVPAQFHVFSRKESSQVCESTEDASKLILKNRDSDNFYVNALDRMMNGVLEVRWEGEIKKDIPIPSCLLVNKDPSELTDDDASEIETYNVRVKALQNERQRYRSMLETEIQETNEALSRSIEAFDDKLKDFGIVQIQVQSAILQEKLVRVRRVKRNRLRCDMETELLCHCNEELAHATGEVRKHAEESSRLEAIALELKSRYEAVGRREKSLEEKFRSEFGDLKQPMVEHLLRHYKKRPRIGNFACTSVTYLTEMSKCILGYEKTDILPRDCLNFLRGMDGLDAMPDNLPPQIDASHWKTMCKLRRIKIENEMKVRCYTVELAEAEQTLSFYQKIGTIVQQRLSQAKNRSIDLEKSLSRFTENKEIQLVLKTRQIEIPLPRRINAEYENAILISREEIHRVNEAIRLAGERKLTAMNDNVNLRKVIYCREDQHTRMRLILKHLRDELWQIRSVKLTRDVQQYLKDFSSVMHPEEQYESIQRKTRITKNRYLQLIDGEKARLESIKAEVKDWQRRNIETTNEIERRKNEIRKYVSKSQDVSRKRNSEFRKRKLLAAMKRTRLVQEIQNNYEELLTLHAHLEVLKLRTYPTLRL